jgi:hypothetical protein
MFKLGWRVASTPRTMKTPNPPEKFTQMLRESFSELQIEAQIAPLDLKFPSEVTQTIEAYAHDHFLNPSNLIPLAMKAHIDRMDTVGEEVNRLMRDPASFDWPLGDPILCVTIAFMRKLTHRWTDKVHERLGLTEEEFDPADWWKGPDYCPGDS